MGYVPGPMMYPGLKMRGTSRRDFHGPSMSPSPLSPLSFQCFKLPSFIDFVLLSLLLICPLPSPISFLTLVLL